MLAWAVMKGLRAEEICRLDGLCDTLDQRERVGFGWPTLFTVHGIRRRNYANSISDIEPPGGIIGMTASSFGITTSISTGPGVANASFIVLARSFDFSIRKPRAPYASASLTKFGTDIAEYEYRSA